MWGGRFDHPRSIVQCFRVKGFSVKLMVNCGAESDD